LRASVPSKVAKRKGSVAIEIGCPGEGRASGAASVRAQLSGDVSFTPAQLYFPGLISVAGSRPRPPLRDRNAHSTRRSKARGLSPELQSGMVRDPALIVAAALRQPAVGMRQRRNCTTTSKDSARFPASPGATTSSPAANADADDVVMMKWEGATTSWSNVSKAGGRKN
jgi:hypothetical protein